MVVTADSHNWVLKISNPMVNHGPSDDPSAHIMHRRMTKEMGQKISKLTSAGIQPLNIKKSLMKTRKLPINIPILAIYNQNYKEKSVELKGKSPMQAVIKALKEKGFDYCVRAADDDHLHALFVALPGSINLTKKSLHDSNGCHLQDKQV
jgi:hypothetical protein